MEKRSKCQLGKIRGKKLRFCPVIGHFHLYHTHDLILQNTPCSVEEK